MALEADQVRVPDGLRRPTPGGPKATAGDHRDSPGFECREGAIGPTDGRPVLFARAMGHDTAGRAAYASRTDMEQLLSPPSRAGRSGAELLNELRQPVLVGLMIPPNYGIDYAREFRELFPDVARKSKVARVPFLLEGVAENRDLFQADQLHPTAAAQPRILENVWPVLAPLLKRPPARP